jgi:hypothetical protein
MRFSWIVWSCLLVASLQTAARSDTVERALSSVRGVKRDLFSEQSSVLGKLPTSAEMAAHQVRCRPVPAPQAGVERRLQFDDDLRQRVAALKPEALRKLKHRMGLVVLPLGITGAQVAEFVNHVELLVLDVTPGTPASGVLQKDDIIFGANGRPFVDREDPRPEMGQALVESQSPELAGILTLHIARSGAPQNVEIDLGNTLSYSPTWPYDCPKSEQVLKAAVDYVVRSHPWHRYNFWTTTLLMGAGDERAMELARRVLTSGVEKEYAKNTGGSAWSGGYRLINLCEYYMLTGDSAVLPAVYHQAQGLAHAQYRSGSWSHGASAEVPGTAGGGYGEVNNAGLGAFIGLCLAREIGIEPYEHTIPRSIRFYGQFCGANLPYGLGKPSLRSGRMDNGMNGEAAVAFHILGEREMAERWARTVCYMWMGRERGHAESIFSAAWGPVSTALAPKEERHMFMNHMQWAYEMGRMPEGALTFMRGGRWTLPNMTAATGLFLCLPQRRLRILGADKSVFAVPPPNDALARAAQLYKDKKWSRLETALDDFGKGTGHSPDQKQYASRLHAAYERLEAHAAATLQFVEQSIAEGLPGTALAQLDSLAKFLGEERTGAAALRARLGEGRITDPKRAKVDPAAKRKELAKGLTKGGMGDGFACSPTYINAVNKRGFDGMEPGKIAGFLGHFSGNAAAGAVAALVEHGETVVPLLKRLLEDEHPGVRAGAVATLGEIYTADSDEYRTDLTPALAGTVKLLKPLLEDKSELVRAAVQGAVLKLKVLNDDVYEMLRVMGKADVGLGNFARYGIKDPEQRTSLIMTMIDGANERRDKEPGSYKPLIYAASAHPELCESYLGTAIDTLKNPEVMAMYGFFSNSGSEGALLIAERFAHDPLVLENLPAILRIGMLRGELGNHYWGVHRSAPRHIVATLGPRVFPVVESYLASERKLVARIEAEEERPAWWKYATTERYEAWAAELKTVMELARCAQGEKPLADSIESITEIYIARDLTAWERARVRDTIVERGEDAVPLLRAALATHRAALETEWDARIAEKRIEADAERDRGEKRRLARELAELDAKKATAVEHAGELRELADILDAARRARPSGDSVKTLCRYFVSRPGRSDRYELDYGKQLALVRDTLQRWGGAALPAVRAFMAEDEEALAMVMDALAARETEIKKKHRHTGPLSELVRERECVLGIRDELRDLARLLDCSSRDRLGREDAAELCRMYTRRPWPGQKELIRGALVRSGKEVAPVILEHLRAEREALPDISAKIQALTWDTAKGARIVIPYDRFRALDAGMRRGIAELEEVLRTGT